MDITQLALILVGWQNGENLRRLACKFDLDQSVCKSSQVNASAPEVLAKRSRKLTQVFNLPLLASPFVKGLKRFEYSTRRRLQGKSKTELTF